MTGIVVGNVNTISSKIIWEINNFCLGCKNVGDRMESPRFTVMSFSKVVRWCLLLYPKGKSQKVKDILSLSLYADTEIKAVCKFKLLNYQGKVMLTRNLPERIFGKGGWGELYFASRNFIINPVNGILKNDKMTIVCEITMFPYEERVPELENLIIVDDIRPRRKVITKYEALFNNAKFSDVSLISEGKTIKVHKCILANSSSVFAAMFDTEMKERQDNTVEIVDIKYDVLVEMIRFVYTGEFNNIDALVDELLLAADKYAIYDLKEKCETRMIRELSLDNVIDCLQLADNLHMDKLKEKGIKFVVKNASDVTDKPNFQSLPNDIMCKICCCLAKKGRN